MALQSAVVIGVDQTGGLPQLKGAAADAERVANWLSGEGFEVTLLSDTRNGARGTGEVKGEDVRVAISKIVSEGTCEQLVVYFAGHGLNNFGTEIWLLSQAPLVANEAINLGLSVDMARDCGIRQICIISDACRSNPPAGPMRRVTGISMFPNQPPPPGPRGKVDRLLPTVPNAAANEIDEKIEDVITRAGIFTTELLRAHGVPAHEIPLVEDPERTLVRRFQRDGKNVRVIDLSNLAEYLEENVPLAASSKGISWPQQPECIVETPPKEKFLGRALFVPQLLAQPVVIQGKSVETTDRLEASVLRSEAAIRGADQTDHFETETGIQVTGAQVVKTLGINCMAELLPSRGDPFDLIRLHPVAPAGSVFLEFSGGTGTVTAALHGYIASIHVSNGRVENVSYVPSSNSYRWQDQSGTRLGELRAEVAAQFKHGVFQLRGKEAENFADRIRIMKGVDPTLGLYAAYAYHDAGRLDEIRSVLSYMLDDLQGYVLFDVRLLAQQSCPDVPFSPLLMRGWPYMLERGGAIRQEILEASEHLIPGLWTTFDAKGLAIIREAINSGRLQ